MFGSEILDVALGLILIYLLLSLVASAVTEIIEAFRKKRASDLERGIRTLLADPEGKGLAKQFYEHPLVAGLSLSGYDPQKIKNGRYAKGSGLPSYVPSRNFALTLMDLVLPERTTGTTDTQPLNNLKTTVDAISNPHLKKVLGSIVSVVGNDLDLVREEIEAWYDSGMDRVSGWYKRYAQWVLLAVGFVIAVVVNADTVALSRSLAQDEGTRRAMLELVQDYLEQQGTPGAQEALPTLQESSPAALPPSLTNEQLAAYLNHLDRVGLPLAWNLEDPRAFPGWDASTPFASLSAWAFKLLGWLITALAVSLGAPFWFDLLNKFMVIRSTVRPYEKSPPEPPVDRAAGFRGVPRGTTRRSRAVGAEGRA